MSVYCEVSTSSSADLSQVSAEPCSVGGLPQPSTSKNRVSLEKAWHGLHYLLTGEVWKGTGPLAFLLSGGQQLGDETESPARWFTPGDTDQIRLALSGVSDDELWSRFDTGDIEQQGIYPGIWDEPEDKLKQEYLGYFHELKKVVAAATESGEGLLVTTGQVHDTPI